MAASTKVAPFLSDLVAPYLAASATAAAASCSGGTDGVTCGTIWWHNASTTSAWDGTWGVGQQLCALEVIQSNLINTVRGPLTNTTGGTSQGDPHAGSKGDTDPTSFDAISTGDKAGAAIITIIVLVGWVGSMVWLIF